MDISRTITAAVVRVVVLVRVVVIVLVVVLVMVVAVNNRVVLLLPLPSC
jgi:hypothetical protein